MKRKLKPKNSPPSSATDIMASTVKLIKSEGAATLASNKTARPRGTKSAAKAAVAHHQLEAADPAVVELAAVEPATVVLKSTAVPRTVAEMAAAINSATTTEVMLKPVAVGMMAAVPPMPPELAALTDEINTKFCDLKRLAKAATRTAVELGERLGDLFDHASDGAWDTLVKRTAVNVGDAGSLVAFAEGRQALVEQLSPVRDVPLRDALNHLVNMANALALTAKSARQTNPAPGAE